MYNCTFSFGPFVLCPDRGVLYANGKKQDLGDRATRVLALLAANHGEVVSHADIVAAVWPKSVVEPNNLRVHITSIRKLLRERDPQNSLILNVPRQGYRFHARDFARSDKPRALEPQQYNCPSALSPLIGRNEDVQDVLAHIGKGRLVTIVGAPGVGKSRLALHIGNVLSQQGAMIRWIDLYECNTPQHVRHVFSEALQANAIGESGLTLIADNCEAAVHDTAFVVEEALKENPSLRILATSREPLYSEGELIYRLKPLSWQGTFSQGQIDDLLSTPAGGLFRQRAYAADSFVDFDKLDPLLLQELLELLEGNPLAIECAAAAPEIRDLRALLCRLSKGTASLVNRRRTASPRHTNMRVAIEWSIKRLDDPERALFAELGVFASTFSSSEVNEVAAPESNHGSTLLPLLDSLVAKSLLEQTGATTYRLSKLTRIFANECLVDDGLTLATQRRHACYFLVRALGKIIASSVEEDRITAQILTIWADLTQALHWALFHGNDVELGESALSQLSRRHLPDWCLLQLASAVKELKGQVCPPLRRVAEEPRRCSTNGAFGEVIAFTSRSPLGRESSVASASYSDPHSSAKNQSAV
ncbi:ATP-binding protein [Paraburkholderia tropica]|uniref:ATP-binding protein n=1 Tax=Paraburkholderia tropica TaxID=92647 RepID=UPI002ABE9CD0|nr:winged helix-turn-helix domain-containing protein [Paraburkholderia tropica]